jgi:hypothetical protein
MYESELFHEQRDSNTAKGVRATEQYEIEVGNN